MRYSETCDGHAPSLRSAVNILLMLTDYGTAVVVSSKLIELEPFNDNGYFLRAVANGRGGSSQKAIDDYTTAIELFGNKQTISSVSYLGMARSYEKLGQFCDAITPIETWVALNRRATIPARRARSSRPIAARANARPPPRRARRSSPFRDLIVSSSCRSRSTERAASSSSILARPS